VGHAGRGVVGQRLGVLRQATRLRNGVRSEPARCRDPTVYWAAFSSPDHRESGTIPADPQEVAAQTNPRCQRRRAPSATRHVRRLLQQPTTSSRHRPSHPSNPLARQRPCHTIAEPARASRLRTPHTHPPRPQGESRRPSRHRPLQHPHRRRSRRSPRRRHGRRTLGQHLHRRAPHPTLPPRPHTPQPALRQTPRRPTPSTPSRVTDVPRHQLLPMSRDQTFRNPERSPL
jgi:hypothetical protein